MAAQVARGDILMFINGLRIFVNPMCERLKVWHTVERHPIKKRRRAWSVRRHEKREPCAYQTPQGIFMHPTLYAQLVAASKESTT